MAEVDRGERLQKVLARAGIASRRKVEELIREGRVTVDGRAAVLGDRVRLDRDAVKVDGKLVRGVRHHQYLLLNKPRGVLTACSDPEGRRTVLDLVPPGKRKALFPVGRLDYQSEGLLLLTTDGDFAERVSHPRYGCLKRYHVKVRGRPSEEALKRLRGGIVIDGRRTAPCRIQVHRPARQERGLSENSWWRVELGEGRSGQIRKMFQRVGHPVQRLRRVAIGRLSDPRLPPGSFRDLTPRELERFNPGERTPGAKGKGR